MVITEVILPVGTYILTFHGVCGGYNVYGIGTCDCITTDFKTTVSIKDIETVETSDIETAPQEVSFTEEIQTIVASKPGGFLWIREDDNKLFN